MQELQGFREFSIATEGAVIHGRVGGDGPPVLLLHGYPQSHLMWRRIAPGLALRHTVVLTDLRGYGDSSKPPDGIQHAGYSKRAMAQDQLEVMEKLGHPRFAVVGHDRGGRVAHRLALDHPAAVERLAILDVVPTLEIFEHVTPAFAKAYFHWFFLIQPAPLPETLLLASPEYFLREAVFRGLVPSVIAEDVFATYLAHFRDPAAQHAMCEDYRAAASIDLEHDRADRGRRLRQPLMALWAEHGAMHALFDVLATWRSRAVNVTGRSLPSTHWMPEEAPAALLGQLGPFLQAGVG